MAAKNTKYWQQRATAIAAEEGIPSALFLSLISAESGWNPNAVSPAGAIGLGQLMPGTARGLGVNPNNPEQNLRGAARYLASMLDRFGSPQLALSAYNSGPGGAEAGGRVEGFAETQAYVKKVMALTKSYGGLDADGNVGSLPMGGKKGKQMKQITSFLKPPSDLGLRANLGPLSARAVGDIQRRAQKSLLVAQPMSKSQVNKNPQTRNASLFNPVGYGLPGVKWTGGGGAAAHGARAIGNWQSDNAVDLLMSKGSPIYAMMDGVIGDRFGPLNSSDPKMAGLRLNLHGQGQDLYYAHLSAFAPGIKPGTAVKKGQLLGFSGTANGVEHLHLGFRAGSPDYLLNYWQNHPKPKKPKKKKPR